MRNLSEIEKRLKLKCLNFYLATFLYKFEEMHTFSLSLDSFKQINFDLYPRDFSFIVGNSTFSCNHIIADFISPIIRRIHQTDISVNQFVVSEDKNIPAKEFKSIILLGEGKEIILEEHNIKQIAMFLNKLENYELFSFLKPQLFTELKTDNCINIYLLKKEMNQSTNHEIEFISNHLYEIENEELEKLEFDDFYQIFSSKKLCILNEDWLFDFIMKLFLKNDEYNSLFEFVDFRFLSTSRIQKFIDVLDCDIMSSSIYKAISLRLLCEITPQKKPVGRYKKTMVEHSFIAKNTLDGIIKYLTLKTGGNIASNKTVDITCSSVFEPSRESSPINALDLDTDSHFFSNCGPNQWLCIDFKNRMIFPTHYSLKTTNKGPNNHQPRNWCVEVSNDGKTWEEIDKKESNSVLNNKNSIGTFSISSPKKCRYIKIRLTGKTSYDTDYFVLAGFEVFGKLYEES